MRAITALGVAAALLLGSAPAFAMEVHTGQLGGVVEGLALGDVDGDGRMEVAAMLRNGTFDAEGEAGSLALFDAQGGLLWEKRTGRNLAGHPTMADFNGDGRSEIAFCEFHEAGRCIVVDGTGRELWASPAHFYPGMTGMAPAAIDLNGDGKRDLISSSWGGTVIAQSGRDGGVLFRTEVYELLGENLFSNPTMVDVSGDGTPDVVVVGASKGLVIALDGRSGGLLWASESLYGKFGNFSRGNGVLATTSPSGEGQLWITLAGDMESAVFLLNRSGRVLGRTVLPGSLDYMSAVSADVDGDRKREVFVQSTNGQLFQMDSAAKVVRSVKLGDESWVPPAFIDADGDGVTEILGSTIDTLLLLEGANLSPVGQYQHSAFGIQPSPVVADCDRNGRVEFWVGSWYGRDLVRASLFSSSLHRWDTIGGGVEHLGELPLGSGNGTVVAMLSDLEGQLAGTLDKAATRLQSAISDLLQGDAHKALGRLKQAVKELDKSPSGAAFQKEIAELGLRVATELVDRGRALSGSSSKPISSADASLTSARSALASQGFDKALQFAEKAVQSALGARLSGSGFCGEFTPKEPLAATECQLISLASLLDTNKKKGESKEYLEGLAELIAPDLEDHLKKVSRVSDGLPASHPLLPDLAQAEKSLSRLYLDEVRVGLSSPRGFSEAEAAWEAGVDALSFGQLSQAIAAFEEAVELASELN